jgi:zinc protease
LALQELAAYFVHPAFREQAWSRSWEIVRPSLATFETTAEGVAGRGLLARLGSLHPGFTTPTSMEVSARTYPEFKAWLRPELASAPIEITLVGEIDRVTALPAVAQTFGALPPRASGDPYREQRKLKFPPQPFSETIPFHGSNDVAMAALAWPAPEAGMFPERLRGNILAAILEDRLRLKLRVELGETYSPTTMFDWDSAFMPSPTTLKCFIETAPTRAVQVAALARDVAEKLAREGATLDEFERARHPLISGIQSDLRDNAWLLSKLETAQSFPAESEGWVQALQIYQSATLDEVNTLARRVLARERMCQVSAQPN